MPKARCFPRNRSIAVRRSEAVTFGAPLQEPEIIISADSITVEGADATFGAPLREP